MKPSSTDSSTNDSDRLSREESIRQMKAARAARDPKRLVTNLPITERDGEPTMEAVFLKRRGKFSGA